MSEEKKSLSKGLGKLASSMLNLANKGAKKLESYANKSAEENNNENAKKLAGWMSNLSKNIEEKHDAYVAKVESNADELVSLSKKALDKAKGVYGEMKQRADIAKEKAEQDTKPEEATAPVEKPAASAEAPKEPEPVTESVPETPAEPAAETEVAATEAPAESEEKA